MFSGELKEVNLNLFHSDCREKGAAPEGQDDEAAKRLWEESARLVGLKDMC